MSVKQHPFEKERLSAVRALELLDTLPEREFDEITELAAQICQVPVVLFTIVDEERVWFKSRHGLVATHAPRDKAFCSHAILFEEGINVPDLKSDPRFSENSLVLEGFRFYAGVPVLDAKTQMPVGTLCVLDYEPTELSDQQIQALKSLKNQIQRLLVLRAELKASAAAEENLKKTTKRLEYVLTGAGLGSWDWWLETNRVQFDRLWCEMLGLRLEDIAQSLSTWDERVHPEDKAQAYQDIKDYMDGKTGCYENIHRLRHANGSWVWILDRGRISEWDEDGRPVRFTGTHFDITQYRNREILSEEIQRMAHIGGWEADPESMDFRWTDQVQKIFGASGNSQTVSHRWLDAFHPEEREVLMRQVRDCYQGRPFQRKFEIQTSQQVKKWIEITGQPVRDSKGAVRSLRGTVQDVTAQVEAEKAVEISRLHAVHASKLASLGEMSAGVAHEINNPLAIISGNLDLLKKYRADDAKFEKKSESIDKAVKRIQKIINGLRKFSRSSDVAKLASHSLAEVVREAVNMVETKTNRYSVPVEVRLDSESHVLCDPMEIEQVLINLINNGVDAVKGAGERWIRIHLFEDSSEVVIQVIDSGTGISHDIQGKLFQPFFTTKPVGEGTGLGLSICKGILDHHQASFRINPQLPNTCFEIRFQKIQNPEIAVS